MESRACLGPRQALAAESREDWSLAWRYMGRFPQRGRAYRIRPTIMEVARVLMVLKVAIGLMVLSIEVL